MIEGGGGCWGPIELVFSQEVGEGGGGDGVAFDEFSVESRQSKETSKASSGSGSGPIHHGLDFIRVRSNTL